MVHVKTNVGPYGGALGCQTDKGILCWTGPSTLTEADLFQRVRRAPAEGVAVQFLLAALKGGPRNRDDVQREGALAGISARTLRRASETLGIKYTPVRKQGRIVGSMWSL